MQREREGKRVQREGVEKKRTNVRTNSQYPEAQHHKNLTVEKHITFHRYSPEEIEQHISFGCINLQMISRGREGDAQAQKRRAYMQYYSCELPMNGCSGKTEKNVHLVRGSNAHGVVIPSDVATIRGLTLHCFRNAAFRNMRRPKTHPSGPGRQPGQMERVTGTHSESRLSPTLTSQDSRSRSASRSRKKSRCRRWHTYGGRKTSAKT